MGKSHILERRFFSKGASILREGDEGFIAFLVQAGRVRVFREKDGKKIDLSVLEAGDIFGETALVLDTKRSASVEALQDTNLIVITRDVFQDKLKNSDPTVQAVVKMLSDRISKSNSEIVKSKGVNVDSFIALLNQLFKDLLEAMPEDKKQEFKSEAFPAMKQLTDIVEKYRDYLS